MWYEWYDFKVYLLRFATHLNFKLLQGNVETCLKYGKNIMWVLLGI